MSPKTPSIPTTPSSSSTGRITGAVTSTDSKINSPNKGVESVASPSPVAASPRPRALLAPSIGQQLIGTAGGRAFLGEIAGTDLVRLPLYHSKMNAMHVLLLIFYNSSHLINASLPSPYLLCLCKET